MSTGFRKSFFGFKSQDVMDYIDRTHRSFANRENELNLKINELTSLLKTAENEQKKLETEKAELNAKIDSFNDKYDEIERLSENIGKLYLVAQSNAQAIMNNAKEEARLAEEEAKRNMITIDETHEALSSLRSEILRTSQEFSQKVDTLVSSLSETREKLAADCDDTLKHSEDFDKVFKSITDERI